MYIMVCNAERLIQNKMLCVDEYYPCKQVTLQSQKCILYSPQALPLNTPPLLSLRREKKKMALSYTDRLLITSPCFHLFLPFQAPINHTQPIHSQT